MAGAAVVAVVAGAAAAEGAGSRRTGVEGSLAAFGAKATTSTPTAFVASTERRPAAPEIVVVPEAAAAAENRATRPT